jgi:hypothetical protein
MLREHFSCAKRRSQKSIWHLADSHVLSGWVSSFGYLCFLRRRWSGLSNDVSFNGHLHSWFQHDGEPKHLSGEVRQWLYATLVVDVKLRFPDLHVHLTWILYIAFYDIWKLRYVPVESILQRKCGVEFNIYRWNKYTRNLRTLVIFFTQSWVVCPWTWRPFPAQVKVQSLLKAFLFVFLLYTTN